MHIYDLTVPQLIKTLRSLDRWVILASTHAETAQLPVETLMNARLAPDQFSFVRQVQVATDNAKFIPGRLSGKEWPSHPDTETTFEQLRERISSVSAYVESFKPDDFDDLDRRKIKLPWMKEGTWLEPHDYVVQFGLPNFYFHVITAYSILRHKGVKLGKNDFIGGLPIQS
jgi:uncharacterized protein